MRLVTTKVWREHHYTYVGYMVYDDNNKLVDTYNVQLDYSRGVPSLEVLKKHFSDTLEGYRKAMESGDLTPYMGIEVKS